MSKTLLDVNHIIMPIGDDIVKSLKTNIDSMFENLIVHNNQIFNTYIFNHIMYKNNDINFQQNTVDLINRHFCTHIRKTLQFFRENNKKNKFTLASLNEYIETFYKLLVRVNNTVTHIEFNNNTSTETKKWGSSLVIDTAINNLHRLILNDNIVNIAIQKSIYTHLDIERNDEMWEFIKNINIFSNYIIGEFNLINMIEDALVKNIPITDFDIPIKLLEVYRFKNIYSYTIKNNKKYYYICKVFPKLINILYTYLVKIANNDVEFLQCFIKEYYYQIKTIISFGDIIHTPRGDIILLFLTKNIPSFDSLIKYYGTIYDIFKDNTTIQLAIQSKITSIETSDMISNLAQLINNNIITSQFNEFLYIVGSIMKNKDEFIKNLCNRFMYRIIYYDIDTGIEKMNYNTLTKYFAKGLLFQYSIILDDFISTVNYTKHVECENKIIVTSLDSWNINHTIGHLDLIISRGSFSEKIKNITDSYHFNNRHKKLIVYPHIGTVDITINNPQKTNIILSPAQMLCFELFENKTIVYTKESLFERLKEPLSLYSDKFIRNIIKSLEETVLCFEDIYIINEDMPENINLIKIFNDINNTSSEIKKFTNIELAHERNDILMANINSRIKQVEESLENLYIYCRDTITFFDVTQVLFDKAIQTMKDKKYIDVSLKKITWLE